MRSFGLIDAETERTFREVQAYFRLPGVGLVEKDLQVVRAIATVLSQIFARDGAGV
jgi:hypothetical protein